MGKKRPRSSVQEKGSNVGSGGESNEELLPPVRQSEEEPEVKKVAISKHIINTIVYRDYSFGYCHNSINIYSFFQQQSKWINKQRVLIFGCRGLASRDRHLMEDLRTLMPHSKSDSKMHRKKEGSLFVVNEIAEMKNCNKCILFESRRKRDLYLWMANVARGPSAKFQVQNVHTMAELKMTGNCLKGSRPLLSFDKSFDSNCANPKSHFVLLRELFTQIFSVPNRHPKSQPFFDRVYSFR